MPRAPGPSPSWLSSASRWIGELEVLADLVGRRRARRPGRASHRRRPARSRRPGRAGHRGRCDGARGAGRRLGRAGHRGPARSALGPNCRRLGRAGHRGRRSAPRRAGHRGRRDRRSGRTVGAQASWVTAAGAIGAPGRAGHRGSARSAPGPNWSPRVDRRRLGPRHPNPGESCESSSQRVPWQDNRVKSSRYTGKSCPRYANRTTRNH